MHDQVLCTVTGNTLLLGFPVNLRENTAATSQCPEGCRIRRGAARGSQEDHDITIVYVDVLNTSRNGKLEEYLESQNIPSWKTPIGIMESNSQCLQWMLTRDNEVWMLARARVLQQLYLGLAEKAWQIYFPYSHYHLKTSPALPGA